MNGQRFEVEAVVLDLDDTIIREHDYVLSGYAAVAAALSPALSVPESQLLDRLTEIYDGPNRSRAFNALLDPFGRPDLVAACIDSYRCHIPRIGLTDSAEALLTQLLGQVPVGVVTDGPLVMQEAKIEALGLRDRGVKVICTDALGGRQMWKPSPAGLVAVLNDLGAPPRRAVYIGDNPHKDFLAASRAGMHSVRLRQPGQLHASCQAERGADAGAEIPDLADAFSVINLVKQSSPHPEQT